MYVVLNRINYEHLPPLISSSKNILPQKSTHFLRVLHCAYCLFCHICIVHAYGRYTQYMYEIHIHIYYIVKYMLSIYLHLK